MITGVADGLHGVLDLVEAALGREDSRSGIVTTRHVSDLNRGREMFYKTVDVFRPNQRYPFNKYYDCDKKEMKARKSMETVCEKM